MAPRGHEIHITRHIGGSSEPRDIEATIAELAARQHGRVARWQLLQLGLGEDAIDYRLRRSRFHVLCPGVYAVGHAATTREGRWMAAVLVGGPGAALGGFAGGAHWGMVRNAPALTDVTVPRNRANRPGLRFHRVVLPSDEVTVRHGIPITTPPRTLFDMAAALPLPRHADKPPRRLEAALNEAEVLRLWDELSLDHLLARYPGHRGTRAIRLALELRRAGATRTRSDLEDEFVVFVDEFQFRRPELNVPFKLGGRMIEIDAMWRAERIAVELDSRGFHDTAAAFESDRRRDRQLTALGWRPVRITWKHVLHERRELAADLGRMLLGPSTLAA